jgi:hypothetical protein
MGVLFSLDFSKFVALAPFGGQINPIVVNVTIATNLNVTKSFLPQIKFL